MKFGVSVHPDQSIEDLLGLAKAAEGAGFDFVWFTDHYFLRDSFVTQALACQATKRVKIGSAVTSPFLRHPLAIASAVATLDEVSKGRIVLGIGPGGFEFKSQLLMEMKLPLTATEEAVEVIRRALRGELVSFHGKVFSVEKGHLRFNGTKEDRIPIYLAARGPKMMQLSGRVADGIITHGVTDKFVSHVSDLIKGEAARASRTAQVDLVIHSPACITSEREKAVKALAPSTTFMAGGEYSDDFLELYGLTKETIDPLRQAIKRGDAQAYKFVTPEMIDSFGILGTSDQIIEKVRRLESLGLTQISIEVPKTLTEQGLISSVPDFLHQFGEEVINRSRS